MIFGRRRKIRWLRGFFLRPYLPFALEFFLIAPLVLGLDAPGIGPLYLFLSPWLLFVLGILNLPLLMEMFRLFRMDVRVRRNHALEHATIHFLRASGARVAGRAELNGFRISGGASPTAIRTAFDQVRALIRAGQPLPHVSRHCGSNRVTALGLGGLLLLAVAVVSLAVRPSLTTRALALTGVALAFVILRHAIGNRVQARFFMATDFADAWVRSTRKVKASEMETPPVYFIETSVVERGAVGTG